jgi:hypothetical protein
MELDYEELIATRKLNGVGDKLFKRQIMSMKERQDLIDFADLLRPEQRYYTNLIKKAVDIINDYQ